MFFFLYMVYNLNPSITLESSILTLDFVVYVYRYFYFTLAYYFNFWANTNFFPVSDNPILIFHKIR